MRSFTPIVALSALLVAACDRGGSAVPGKAPPTGDLAPSGATPSGSVDPIAAESASAAPAAVPPAKVVPAAELLAAADRGCRSVEGAHVAISPARLGAGAPLRILSTVEGAAPTAIAIRAPSGAATLGDAEIRSGPPSSAFVGIASAEAGTYRVVVARGADVVACLDVEVPAARARMRRTDGRATPWEPTRAWTRADEDLYAAWIEKLFDAPLADQPSYDALYEITTDPKKNFLFDHFGLDEDAPPPKGLRLDPDCADLPYYLRAYFAWKQGLPFGFSSCTRGSQGHAPTCLEHRSSLEPMEDPPRDVVRKFERFVRKEVADTVHSGTGRTRAEDSDTDYYPVEVSRETLRPGTIYADPYGHVLVVAKVVPESADAGGVLLAVDGQPDGTVGRKRFWEGNFLFSLDDVAMGSPGFKRFRKVYVKGGEVRRTKNEALASDPAYADFGENQYAGDATAFYDLMEDVLSPVPRDPEQALLETIQALDEQVRTRLVSVGNGEARFEKKTQVIDMPDGPSIFETTGDWEDFSTPSRDLRLLIAIDVATGFPARFARRPTRYRAPQGKTVDEEREALAKVLSRELATRTVTYTRSDGSPFVLRLADVVARQKALEIAYNPNDCVEHRWGAPDGSDEAKTCRRHAPSDQRRKMEKVRAWFADRKRPARK